jgi:uncharacterized protein
MQEISALEIIQRVQAENPWWEPGNSIGEIHQKMKPRAYFKLLFPLIKATQVQRAIVLMGPRRVGKTVMIYHCIQQLIRDGVHPKSICYFSVDHPIYNGLRLDKLLQYYGEASGIDYKFQPVFVFFDEIQYLREWEVHLKSAVDTLPNVKFIASGSAAAALRLKSQESGAGRFTDFLLPPLTFYEYLSLLDKLDLVDQKPAASVLGAFWGTSKIAELNEQFLFYLNYGGYPEVIFSEEIRKDPGRFIKNDIIDKVLLRDLPSLYGIRDIQELNYLFTSLAFNTANEVSLQELSQNSGVAKNTIKRYVDYLEAAFLLKLVHRVDHNAKRFDRANFFKVYLTNPSMRAALFAPISVQDPRIGSVAETSIFSQWFHSETKLYYARWGNGEVDMVHLDEQQRVAWAVEVKWSDRYCENPDKLEGVISFCQRNKLKGALITSLTKTLDVMRNQINLRFLPASLYCFTVGYNIIHHKKPIEAISEAK